MLECIVSAVREACEREGSPFAGSPFPANKLRSAIRLLQKLTQLPNRCLDFILREILVELTDENAPEFWNGGKVAGAGFVPKSVAEDSGAGAYENLRITPMHEIYHWLAIQHDGFSSTG
jgi:hypothetical protein